MQKQYLSILLYTYAPQLTVLAMQQGLALLGTKMATPSGIWCLVWMFSALRSAAYNT